MSKSSPHKTTDSEIDRAILEGQAFDRNATRIVEAQYDQLNDQLITHLSTGATLTIPRTAIPFLTTIAPDAIGEPEVEAPGYGIWLERPDCGYSPFDLNRDRDRNTFERDRCTYIGSITISSQNNGCAGKWGKRWAATEKPDLIASE